MIVDCIDDDRVDGTATPEKPGDQRRRIDVTELDATDVQEFVRTNVGTDRVSLEHRGARTYLVVEG
ncbi:hypothetical protein OB905_09945 [Halobacteria archaeon AArc-dxtr1]|nr:hypothetical protein [Halobacteria archaeon AArc-dxtr1]